MVYVEHVAQPFNHAKQLIMLRLSFSHLIIIIIIIIIIVFNNYFFIKKYLIFSRFGMVLDCS